MAPKPMLGVDGRFLGGPWDGQVERLPENLLTGFRVPEPVDLLDIMADASPTDPILPSLPKIHLYRWDGTINDAGERRMRWSGEPR